MQMADFQKSSTHLTEIKMQEMVENERKLVQEIE